MIASGLLTRLAAFFLLHPTVFSGGAGHYRDDVREAGVDEYGEVIAGVGGDESGGTVAGRGGLRAFRVGGDAPGFVRGGCEHWRTP